MEHHANIVPWQQPAAKKGLKLRVIPVDDDGQILLGEYAKLLNPKTKLVSFTPVSIAHNLLLRRFGVETTIRPSLAFYNTASNVDLLVETLYRLRHAKNKS